MFNSQTEFRLVYRITSSEFRKLAENGADSQLQRQLHRLF